MEIGSRRLVGRQALAHPEDFLLLHPTGGLISSARDQLCYARFHLGGGTAPDGTRLLSPASLVEMRMARGPDAAASVTANAEVYGRGVGWGLEQIGDVQIVRHSGGTFGQMSVLALVPERGFAVAVFTNASPQGGRLTYDVSTWALQAYLGLSTPLPTTVDLPAARLAEYVGRYGVEVDVSARGGGVQFRRGVEVIEIAADGGGLFPEQFPDGLYGGAQRARHQLRYRQLPREVWAGVDVAERMKGEPEGFIANGHKRAM